MRWDPDRYLAFADERSRPFAELVARVPADHLRTIVDLGCGPGHLTPVLTARWPGARVHGLDASAEMVASARGRADGATYDVADLRDWLASDETADLVVSNATLQWGPGHLDLLPALVEHVLPGGWLAVGVPANFQEPSHVLREELAAQAPYAVHTAGVAAPSAHPAWTYLEALAGLGCAVDAGETTYLHVLAGEDPVFTWISGTGARPTLQALPDDLRGQFEAELKARLRAAYPPGPAGVVLPFRRVFVVAQVPA
jgi:trans-aconitate 2-methyltransferase